ncbi:hypothetical protein L9F63_004222, partial [Diploptera punctata]
MDFNQVDLSLDGIYRAVSKGLQVAVGSTVLLVILRNLLVIPVLGSLCSCSAFLLFTIIGTAYGFYLDTLKISLKNKGVLITGCDSGFGYDLALRLERMGAVVFAGCLNTEQGGGKDLKKMNLKNLHAIQFNVISESDLSIAVEYVNKHLPTGGLWGIVNNAGLSTFGFVEWVPISTCKKLMDVNVWGMIRVIQAFLPLVRESKGRVVNMSSGLSRFSFANRSTYGITKFAVQPLCDCLRYEMRRWGVNVSVIEPGNFVNATGIFTTDVIRKQAADLWEQMSDRVKKDYTKDYYDNLINNMIKYSTVG